MREMPGRALLLALLACAPLSHLCAGELRNYHHASWTAENGLGSVFEVQQAPDGYLWLTTSRGIFRFDGVRFQSVDQATGGAARNKDLDTAFVSRDGGIWFSTLRKGLLLWKGGKITEYPDRRCTPGVKAEGFAEDPDGSLWIRASAGLSRLRKGKCEQVGKESNYPGGYAKAHFIDRRGMLWIEMQSGRILYRTAGQEAFQAAPDGLGAPAELAYLHEAPDGAIWLSDGAGLRRITDSQGIPLSPPRAGRPLTEQTHIRNFTFAADGSIWAATDAGLERFERSVQRDEGLRSGDGERFTTAQGLSSAAIWKLTIDREGTLWTGTSSGLDQFRRSPLTYMPLPLSVLHDHQLAIATGDHGDVWVGSRGTALTNVSPGGQLRTFPQTRQAMSVQRDHNGVIWSSGMPAIGGARLWRTAGAGVEQVPYPPGDVEVAASVAVDRNNDVWINTYAPNVYHRIAGKWQKENQTLGRKPGVIGTMREDPSGNVWFAFSNNLVQWDGTAYQRYSFPDGTLNISVTTLAFRGDRVWLGGLAGVAMFRKGKFQKLQCKDSDLPGAVSGVVETPDGSLWLNGFAGIVHIPAAELERWLRDPAHLVSADRLDALDGLSGFVTERWPEPSVIQAPDGKLWFATAKGVAWLDPQAIERDRNRQPPTVLITNVTGDGKAQPTGPAVRFAPRTKNLQFDYTALSLAVPERVKFRYKLEGTDNAWHDAGTRRQAFYNDLPPGPYRFRVVACNNDGLWSEAGAAMEFAIIQAYYQTAWFKGLFAMALVATLWALWRLRVGRIRRQLEVRFTERLHERERIARELHDTLLQSVVGLMLHFQHAVDRLDADEPGRQRLERALDLAEIVMREGRGRVRDLRSSHPGQCGIVEELAGAAQQFEPLTTATFRYSVQGRVRPLRLSVCEEVVAIAREALVNAFTHANASTVHLEIAYGSTLRVSVSDDGRGIEAPILQLGHRQNHYGLPGMRERARNIRAGFKIECPAGGGTRVELSVCGRLAYQARPFWRLRSLFHSARTPLAHT